jgi:hypothetical protein
MIRQDTLEWRVLNFIEALGSFVFEIWLPESYPEARLWRDILGFDRRHRASEKEKEKLKLLISATLSRLKAKGLVSKAGSTRKANWRLTHKGKKILEEAFIALPTEDGRLRIVIFDIPEIKRRDRDWLRITLISFNFLMLQKSVWIGKRPLPESFFQELADRDLFEAVHIFEIKESGTLYNLQWGV